MGSDATGPPPDIAPRSVRVGFLPPSKPPVPSLSSGLPSLPKPGRCSPLFVVPASLHTPAWASATSEDNHDMRRGHRSGACSRCSRWIRTPHFMRERQSFTIERRVARGPTPRSCDPERGILAHRVQKRRQRSALRRLERPPSTAPMSAPARCGSRGERWSSQATARFACAVLGAGATGSQP
jgi:hypothetical protein